MHIEQMKKYIKKRKLHANALVNLTKQQNDNDFSFIDKTYSNVKDANGVKY